MKRLLAFLAIGGMFTFASCNGTSEGTEGETETEEVTMAAHGEEGHVCDESCAEFQEEETVPAAHGEEGHVCDESCSEYQAEEGGETDEGGETE